MIIHTVRIGPPGQAPATHQGHRKIYVGSARKDLRYRDLLVEGRHRWEFFTRPTIEFLTRDGTTALPRDGELPEPMEKTCEGRAVVSLLEQAHGALFIVTCRTLADPLVLWEMERAEAMGLPLAGVAVGRHLEGRIPPLVKDRMIRYGWEWFAEFINDL